MLRREYSNDDGNIFYFDTRNSGNSGYDAAGNLNHITYYHKEDGANTLDYQYTKLNQLLSFDLNSVTQQSYDYDDNGNILQMGANTYSYEPIVGGAVKTNRLTDDGNRLYHYDEIGRATTIDIKDVSKTDITMDYDLFSNMIAITNENGTFSYAYDAHNTRIRKTSNGVNRYYITSGPQVLSEYAEADVLDVEHVYANGQMIASYSPASGYGWFYTDHLGSTPAGLNYQMKVSPPCG